MRIELLGGFGVEVNGRLVPEGSWRLRRARTLVKVLALAPGHRLHRDQAAGLLWPGRDPLPAANNFHQVLHATRAALSATGAEGDRLIELSSDLVVLHGDGTLIIDVEAFAGAAERALESHDSADVRAAVTRYRGELLPEDRYEEWATGRREELARTHRALLVEHADALARAGRVVAALAALQEVLDADPRHEPAIRAMMGVLAASGRSPEALARYERFRDDLWEAYGSEPDPQTCALFRDLLAGSVNLPVASPAARPRRRGPRHNLPPSLSSFVGRDRELAEVRRLLTRTRILTLTGPGGVGKTRLAEEAGRRVAGTYPDGVWLTDVGPIADARLVPDMLAAALGLQPGAGGDLVRALARQIGDMRAMVVLDNCEHLVNVCAHLAAALVRLCPLLTVLATSREPLHVPGEITFRVPSLEVPPAGVLEGTQPLGEVSSVRLFCDRAEQARAGFALDAVAQRAVTAICRRLDGVPLAVELAAARVAHLEVGEIAERLGDSLSVLGHGPRGVTRHATLRAALEWSHGLLSDDERTLLRRLSVFAGSFSLTAAEAVCPGGSFGQPDVLDCLGRLVDKSLVQAEPSDRSVRYRLLETVRQFAREQLAAAGETATFSRAHCERYLTVAAAHDPERPPGFIDEDPRVLDVEQDNLRSALSWALDHDPAMALRLAARVWRFWLARGHFAEGQGWLERALEAAPGPAADRSRALVALAAFDCRLGRTRRLTALADKSVAVLRGSDLAGERLRAKMFRGFLFFLASDLDQAERIAEQTQAQAGGRRDPAVGAGAVWLRALIALCREDVAAALPLLEDAEGRVCAIDPSTRPFFPALTICMPLIPAAGRHVPAFEETLLLGRRVGAEQAFGYLRSARGYAARFAGDYAAARSSVSGAAELFRGLGDRTGLAVALNHLGCIARDCGDFPAARRHLAAALRLRREVGDRRGEHLTSCNLGLLAASCGQAQRARRTIAGALTGSRAIGDGPWTAASLFALGIVDLHDSGTEPALTLFERALDALAPQGWGRLEAWPRLLAAELATELGQERRARCHRDHAALLFARLRCRIAAKRLASLPAPRAPAGPGPNDA